MTSKEGTSGASGSSGFTLPNPPASSSGSGFTFNFPTTPASGTTSTEKSGTSTGFSFNWPTTPASGTTSTEKSGTSTGFSFNWPTTPASGTTSTEKSGTNTGFSFNWPATTASGTTSTEKSETGSGFSFNWSSTGSGFNFGSGAASSGFNFSFGTSYKFNFGTGKEFTGTTDPKTPFQGPASALAAGGAAAAAAPAQPEDDSAVGNNAVQDVGEDGEERLIEMKAILYELVEVKDEKENTKKQYAERGRGIFHVNKAKTYHRVLMRREHTGRGVLNMRVWKGMNLKVQNNNVTFMGVNAIAEEVEGEKQEEKDQGKKLQIFLLKVKTKEDAEKIKEVLEEVIKNA